MQEVKVLDKNGVTVTTERIVYDGSKVIRLEEVRGSIPFIDRGWAGLLISIVLAFAVFAEGGFTGILGGLLLLAAGWALFWFTMDLQLLISTRSDEAIHLEVKSTRFLKELDAAIGKALAMRRNAQSDALRDEMDRLPTA